MPRIDPNARRVSTLPINTGPTSSPSRVSPRITHINPSPSTSPSRKTDPLILVYNIHQSTLRRARKSKTIRQNPSDPLLIMSMNNPPLLCDGRMYNIDVPRWHKKVQFAWRTTLADGKTTKVKWRTITLPVWVWVERNFGERWKVLWIEGA